MPATTVKKKSKKDKKKIALYFNTKEYDYVKFVAENLLGVGVRQFAKGSAMEMAKATIDLAKQRDEAAHDSNEARSEEVTTTVDTSTSDERTSAST